MDDPEREPPSADDGGVGETGAGDDVVARTDDFGEPSGGEEPDDDGDDGDDGDEQSDQDRWRRFGWAALVIATIGVGWALVLSTILISRSGDRTADLISLFEQSQEQREAIPGELSQNQDERQAALAAQRQQAELYRAQQSAERAAAFQSNTQARQNIAKSALVEAKTALASIQAQMAQRQLDQPQPSAALTLPQPGGLSLQPTGQGVGELLQTNIQTQQALLKAINKLKRVIRKLREEICPQPPCPG